MDFGFCERCMPRCCSLPSSTSLLFGCRCNGPATSRSTFGMVHSLHEHRRMSPTARHIRRAHGATLSHLSLSLTLCRAAVVNIATICDILFVPLRLKYDGPIGCNTLALRDDLLLRGDFDRKHVYIPYFTHSH